MKTPENLGKQPRTRDPQSERVQLGFRVTPAMKDLVENAALESGRSQSAEMEFRLENSFRDKENFINALDNTEGRLNTGLMLLLGKIMYAADSVSWLGDNNYETWLESPIAFDSVVRTVNDVFKRLRPETSNKPVKRSKFHDDIIRSPLTAVATHRLFEPIRERLGDYCKRIAK